MWHRKCGITLCYVVWAGKQIKKKNHPEVHRKLPIRNAKMNTEDFCGCLFKYIFQARFNVLQDIQYLHMTRERVEYCS